MAMTASQAMPAAPLAQAPAASSDIIHVAQGCGRGWVRGRYGRCHLMRRVFRCRRGWHAGPHGRRCFPNRW
ncbi:MAG: GCG_CRPN prefix-to-repeats domain-containing protein [Bradyrhizobium sp.]